jgi:pilus assembly protein CpaE
LSWLKANAPQSKVIVVANRVASASVQEINRRDFEQSIERKVDIVLPFDQKAASQAAKLGQPLAKVAGNSKLGQGLTTLLNMTVGVVDGTSEVDAPRSAAAGGSLLGKLGNFKSMVQKSKPKAGAA